MATLVLTFVSIWAAQPIKEFFDPKQAEINVSILSGDNLRTVFMVSNTGSRPAGLLQIDIEANDMGRYSTTWYLRSELDEKLIEPGKAYVLTASNGSLIPAPISHEVREVLRQKNIKAKSCDLVLQYVQMNGTKVYKSFPFPCHSVKPVDGRDPLKGLPGS